MADKTKKAYEPSRAPTGYKPDPRLTQPYIAPQNLPNELVNELFQNVKENNIAKINDFSIMNKIPFEIKNSDGETLLHIILSKNPEEHSEREKLESIRQIPNIKVMVLVPNKSGITPLHLAAMYQYHNIINEICSFGMNVSPTDLNGKTPLHYAIIGHTRSCKFMYHDKIAVAETPEKAEVNNIVNNILGDIVIAPVLTPREKELLSYTDPKLDSEFQCINTHLETIKKLIALGASINALDKQKMTPIYYAFKNNDFDVIEFLLKTPITVPGDHPENAPIVTLHTPLNVFGDTPMSYYSDLYKKHLALFSNDASNLDKLKTFTEPFSQQLTQFLSSKPENKIALIDQLYVRSLIMLIEYVRRQCEINLPNELDYLNINESIPIPPGIYNYPIVAINNVPPHIFITVLPANIIELYNQIRDSLRTSEYNSMWNDYVTRLLINEKPFIVHLTELQNEIIQGKFGINDKNVISRLYAVYDNIDINIITPYRQQPETLNNNFILKTIAEIIAHNMANIVCYDMYRKILFIVTEEISKFIASLPVLRLNEIMAYAKQVTAYNAEIAKQNNDQLQYDRDINMVSNNLAGIFAEVNQILLRFQQPALAGVTPANITAFEDLYRFQTKYYEILERILKQITGKELLPQLALSLANILPMVLQPHVAVQQQIINDIEAAISGIEAYLIQNAGLIAPAIKVHKENLSRLTKLRDLYENLGEKLKNIIAITTQIINNPVARPPPPVLPPIIQTIHPVLNPKHQVILNYVNASKDQLFDIIVRQLPRAIVGNILDKSNTDWALDRIPSESMQDLFSNKLVSKLSDVAYPTEEVSKEINKRIIGDIIPLYKETCELAVKDVKRMLDAYINYIANECQYIKIFKLLLDRT